MCCAGRIEEARRPASSVFLPRAVTKTYVRSEQSQTCAHVHTLVTLQTPARPVGRSTSRQGRMVASTRTPHPLRQPHDTSRAQICRLRKVEKRPRNYTHLCSPAHKYLAHSTNRFSRSTIHPLLFTYTGKRRPAIQCSQHTLNTAASQRAKSKVQYIRQPPTATPGLAPPKTTMAHSRTLEHSVAAPAVSISTGG
jgi:hypothetical protein